MNFPGKIIFGVHLELFSALTQFLPKNLCFSSAFPAKVCPAAFIRRDPLTNTRRETIAYHRTLWCSLETKSFQLFPSFCFRDLLHILSYTLVKMHWLDSLELLHVLLKKVTHLAISEFLKRREFRPCCGKLALVWANIQDVTIYIWLNFHITSWENKIDIDIIEKLYAQV